jgi:hypothetical protein
MMLRAMLVIVLLLVGPPMPDRLKVMTHTKRAALVFQVRRVSMKLTTPSLTTYYYKTSTKALELETNGYKDSGQRSWIWNMEC